MTEIEEMKISKNIFIASNKAKVYELVHDDNSIGLGISTRQIYDSFELEKEKSFSYDEFIRICIKKYKIDGEYGVKIINNGQTDYIVLYYQAKLMFARNYPFKTSKICQYIYTAIDEYAENK